MNNEAHEHDDELLSAYLDGELSKADANELERRLARDPKLSERLESMRAMDRVAAVAFHEMDERPMPKRVLELLGEEKERPHASNVVPLWRNTGLGEFIRLPVALAASIALVAGLWLGGFLGNGGAPEGAAWANRIVEDSALYAAFDRAASGESMELGNDRYAEPVLTFRSDGGAWCRQVRITGGPAPAATLACRRNGEWQVELVAFAPAAAAPDEGEYGQASAVSTPAMRAALDELMSREPPLGPAEEADVIDREWETGDPGNSGRE